MRGEYIEDIMIDRFRWVLKKLELLNRGAYYRWS